MTGRVGRGGRWMILVGCASFLALVGFADVSSGWQLSFSLFYLAGIAPAVWYVGRTSGIVLSLLSQAALLAGDLGFGDLPENIWIPYWNASVRLGLLVGFAVLLGMLRSALAREQELARVDPTTGAWNSRAFRQFLQSELQRARRRGQPIALAYVDLDDFKAINDRYGHAVGDRVLKAIADAMRGAVRSEDTVARLGGDEFGLILPETDADGAARALTRVRAAVREAVVACECPVSASFGVGLFTEVPESVDHALRVVDGLMYKAKRAGKDRVLIEAA